MAATGLHAGIAAVGVITTAIMLAGCGDVDRAVNRGGDTTCQDYLRQGAQEQQITVTKYLQQRRGNSEQPNNTLVSLARGGIDMLCAAPPNADVPIKNATLRMKFSIQTPPTR